VATAALPQDPDLDRLRNQARELQRAVRRGEPAALTRVSRWHPDAPPADRFPLTAAQLVLERGADPNIPDQHYQSTPLGWARYSGQPAVAELLGPYTG